MVVNGLNMFSIIMAYYNSRPDSPLDAFQLRYFPYNLWRENSCAPSTHERKEMLRKIYENEEEMLRLLLLLCFIFNCS